MNSKILAKALSAITLAATLYVPATHAQGDYAQPAPTFQGQIMGGFSATSGDEGTYLQDGWVIDAGFIYWLNHGDGLGVRTDASYSDHQATDQYRAFGDGWGDVSAAATGLVYRTSLNGWAHFYGLAQVGISHVRLRLVETSSQSNSYCAPFFYYCGYPTAGTVESYDTNHLSWDLGMGVDFATYWTESWFVEVQYRRIETSPHPFEYWPVMVGLRF
jgi:hypothetical protein